MRAMTTIGTLDDIDVEPDCAEGLVHEWTSEGEGGCDENPGVWSLGGTAMFYRAHCRLCGVVREETAQGSQRNPGERDEITYTPGTRDETAIRLALRARRRAERARARRLEASVYGRARLAEARASDLARDLAQSLRRVELWGERTHEDPTLAARAQAAADEAARLRAIANTHAAGVRAARIERLRAWATATK